MHHLIGQNWHGITGKEAVALFESDEEEGLGVLEQNTRRAMFGENVLVEKGEESRIKQFFMQFHSPLIYILLSAVIVTLLIGEYVDSGVIFAVVLINVIVGYIQESKASKAIRSLKKMMLSTATVIRDGGKLSISSSELVPGDIVLLESGSKISADIRLLQANTFKVDESMLTGESLPVQKNCDTLPMDTTLSERKNMLYSGTYAVYGRAKGVVVATGNNTEMGKIAHLMESADVLQTPLTRKMDDFSRVLLYAILLLAAVTFVIGITREYDTGEMFLASVALAVGAIPEGLPAALTITLAIGVSVMARKNAVIRKLPAVETLGSVTVICSDKTGTLTQNKMTVTTLYCERKRYALSGKGYGTEGEILYEDVPLGKAQGVLAELLLGGYICNESYLINKEGKNYIEGDPTEGALIVAAIKGGLDEYAVAKRIEKIDTLPFESDRRYMGILVYDKEEDKKKIYLKGSVEKIIELCDREALGGETSIIEREKILNESEALAKMGLRVLGVAVKEGDVEKLDEESIGGDFVFLGCQAMIDRPRTRALTAVKECQDAGIKVIMITGDHTHTAYAIAKEMGITEDSSYEDAVISGKMLLEMSDSELLQKVQQARVFARVEPEQKLRIVNALQKNGEIVAMTGDGVNDAPALKQANIGIAMGKSGTEVAKEASDMVLSDDNFASIASAVREGRGVFDNLVKFITWTLPTNLGEGMIVLFSILLAIPLPILPVQILWINMSTALMLGMMLVFEPQEKDIMSRPPRDPKTPILSQELVTLMLLVGIYMLGTTYAMFSFYIQEGASIEYARSVAVNMFVFIELFFLFSCKSLDKSIFQVNLLKNPYMLFGVTAMVVLQALFTYHPFMQVLFKSQSLSFETWMSIVAVSLGVIPLVEFKKVLAIIVRKKQPRGAE